MTLFARKIDTGEAVWGYQKTPFDQWDYDGINEPILVDLTIDGKEVPSVVQFDRNALPTCSIAAMARCCARTSSCRPTGPNAST